MTTEPASWGFRPRQKVRYVGFNGSRGGPTGRVWKVTARGVWVTLPDGRRECWHPDAVTSVATTVTP